MKTHSGHSVNTHLMNDICSAVSGAGSVAQYINAIVSSLACAGVMFVTCYPSAADENSNDVIEFERQILQFTPSRTDLTVGIVWLSVLTPKVDWKVKLPEAERSNFHDAREYKYFELKRVGYNRFELPQLSIQAKQRVHGPVCISVKAWLNEVISEYESLYWIDLDDRYSLLSYCSSNDEMARARYSQNRVTTLQEFRARLEKPIVLKFRRDLAPWRPRIFVDDQGAVYFHSLLIGRHTEGALSHHLLEAWKLSPDGHLARVDLPDLISRPPWTDRIQDLAEDPFAALLRITLTDVVARDMQGNLYAASTAYGQKDSPVTSQLVRIDAKGEFHTIAGTPAAREDDTASKVHFYNITALAAGPHSYLYVADSDFSGRSRILRVTPNGTITTLATPEDIIGFADESRDAAPFCSPSGLAVDDVGNVHFADPLLSQVRKIAPDGVVTTVYPESRNAIGIAEFVQPSGVAVGPSGNLYVLDGGTKMTRVSIIHPDGKVERLVVVDPEVRKSILDSRK